MFKNLIVDTTRKVAYSYISASDYNDYDLSPSYKGSPCDLIKFFGSTDYAIFATQQTDDFRKFRINLRSRDQNYSVLKIAEKLDGGGHDVAAGGIIESANSSRDAIEQVIKIEQSLDT